MCLVNELARFSRVQPQYKLLKERGPAHSKVRLSREVVRHAYQNLSDLMWQVLIVLRLGGGSSRWPESSVYKI